MILPILIAPDPRLKLKALPIEKIDEDVLQLIKDMFDTMYANHGCGLAATQVNVHKRIVVMDLDSGDDNLPKHPRAFINPEVLKTSKETQAIQVGCLSIPNTYPSVTRPKHVTFQYMDEKGTVHQEEATDIFAECIQHEIDHLNGILSIDYLSKLKRDLIIKRLKKYHPPLL